jgi:hypothetical protein
MRYGSISAFTFDLTRDQRRLCAWVAEKASKGVRRIHYGDVKAALDIAGDRDLTRLLKEIRERVDEVHEMVQFPILNTTSPYFDIDMNAGYIWDEYCQAEQEIIGTDYENQSHDVAITHDSEYGRTACAV